MTEISPDIRSITPLVLKNILSPNDIDEFEKIIYKNPKTYYHQVTLIKTFLDPENKLGQVAEFLRNKVQQKVYTPERLATLTVPDALPEIFLNDKLNDKTKASLLSKIQHYIHEKTKEMILNYQTIQNPSQNIPTVSSIPIVLDKNVIKASSMKNIRKMCVNSYWDASEVDTIICKDNGKFYCLDTLDLLKQIASGEAPINPFTKTDIDEEIVSNLIKRYNSKIQDIKQGKDVSLNHYRTEEEIEDLASLKKLFEMAQDLVNQDEIETIQLFGISAIIDEHPTLSRIFTETVINDLDKHDDKVEALKVWIASNLEKIKKGMNETKDKVSSESLSEMNLSEVSFPKPLPISIGKGQELEEGEIPPEEEDVKEIIKPGSLIMVIYNDKINKLKLLQKTVIEDLDTSSKKEMSEILKKIVETQKMMPEYLKSVNGILALLNSELERSIKILEMKKTALKKASPLAQKALLGDLETFINDLKNEISHLSGKKGTF